MPCIMTESTQKSPESTPWGDTEKQEWLKRQSAKRSYWNDVAAPVILLRDAWRKQWDCVVETYGSFKPLGRSPAPMSFFAVRSRKLSIRKPTVLITGGVHGYETSGVHGALAFIKSKEIKRLSRHFNIVVAPCVSPWSYETINRWNPYTENPNREFREGGRAQESRELMDYVGRLGVPIFFHMDLHETTDTDKTVFRPEQHAKDGKPFDPSKEHIPDGFYLVGAAGFPKPDLEKTIIDAVERITHIAEPDAQGRLIGERVRQRGVIDYPTNLGLCAHFTGAHKYGGAITTEVYPDGIGVTPQICVRAQVTAVTAALDHLIRTA